MDEKQVEVGEEEKSGGGVAEVSEEGRQERGTRLEGGLEKTKERMDGEASFGGVGSSPGGHGGVRRFLEGELVEVRQREKGLRGSWHPAVVIGVRLGRRVVEYDELLTDDGREKLTENIPVGKYVDGGRLGAARQAWKSPAKRHRTLIRPRPPPLPDPSITWSKGLSVDCYFKDAWWEGVLTEDVTNTSKQKRALVWFPEEEDWEAMPLKHIRVGQQWDEDTGTWSLKGLVDIPASKRASNRSRTMSLSEKTKGFARNRRRSSPDSMELAIALKIDGTGSSKRDGEYTSAWNGIGETKDDPDAEISVQLNSPKSSSWTPRRAENGPCCGDIPQEQEFPLALRTRSSESSPVPFSSRSPSVRTRGGVVCPAAPSCGGEENAKEASGRKDGSAAMNGNDRGAATVGCRIASSGGGVDRYKMNGDKLILIRDQRSGNAGVENVIVVKNGTEKVGQLTLPSNLAPQEEEEVKQLIGCGWSVSRQIRTNGKAQWHYRSPNGCLLGSLASALGMCKQMEAYNNTSGDDDNPTLSDILTPKSQRGSPHVKGRLAIGSGRTLKSSRRMGSPSSVKEGGQEMDQLEPSIAGHPNGDLVSNVRPLAGSNGVWRSPNVDSAVFPVKSQSNCKRIAFDSEGNELKRRKLQDSLVEQDEPSGFHTLAIRDAKEGSDDNAPGELSVGTTPFPERIPVEMSNYLTGYGPATETRSKKRACLTEGFKRDQGNDLFGSPSTDDSSPSMENEPSSKKSKVVTEASSLWEGKSRKSLAILQESSRKKGSTPHKGADWKQAKKSTNQVKKSTSHVKKGKKSRTPSRAGVRLEVLLSAPGCNREAESDLTKKRTLLSWLIDNGTVSEHEKVRYLHRKDLHCMLEGSVTRDGILCNCCKKVVTLSVFEAHAGSKLHRPSANIFLDDGRSLSVCQVEALAVKTQSETDSQKDLGDSTLDKSDDTCGICGDGGELICCDHCPSTFHLTCMGLQGVPPGDWYCPNCRCAACGESQFIGDQTSFNDLTVIMCQQCECEYHVKCLREKGLNLSALPEGDFFCRDSCERIFQGLRSLVGICTPMEGGFSWTLLRSGADDDRNSGCISNAELNAEHDSKLSIALSVMQECFRPMIDPRTKIDIITHVLYNRRSDVSRLNYHGFYTMLLERGDELISVATIRVHGARLAELPLIGTRFQYRRQGMCRRLMSAIEKMLFSLGVERLVLPAVPELLGTWTGAFGFQPMDESDRLQLMDLNIMAFPGTSTLYKRLENVEPVPEVLLPSMDEPPTCAAIMATILQKEHPDASLAGASAAGKKGRGRPPKTREEITNSISGVGIALPEAVVGAPEKLDHTANQSESLVASQYVAAKRGRGRPPKTGNTLFKPSDGAKLAVSMAVVKAHELVEAGYNAGHMCSPADGFSGKALSVIKDGGHQLEKETLPTVVRKKRGRPPRARINYNIGSGIMSATAMSIQVEQVAGFHGGRIQVSTSEGEAEMGATQRMYPVRLTDGFISTEVRGDAEYTNSVIVSQTSHSLREMKTPMWLVKSDALTRERSCRALAVEAQADIPPLESSTTHSTRMYERRRSGLSPSSQNEPLSMVQDDGSDGEPICGHVDFYDEDYPQSDPGPGRYESVSVPIRTFPSQFASRGDHSTPPGTFIPVETIVVNSQSKAENLDEFLVPERETDTVEPPHPERDEQKCGNKLLLRLKFPRKRMSPDASCDAEISEPSPTLQPPIGGPSTFTVSDQISKDVNRFEQFDQGQLKQNESTMGSHCIPVSVS